MYVFFNSDSDSGVNSIKAVDETLEGLQIKIAKYALTNVVGTDYFEVGYIDETSGAVKKVKI